MGAICRKGGGFMARWMFGAGDETARVQMLELGFSAVTDNRADLKPEDLPGETLWRSLPAFSRR